MSGKKNIAHKLNKINSHKLSPIKERKSFYISSIV